MAVDRDALKARATELGIEFDSRIPTTKLKALVEASEIAGSNNPDAGTPAEPSTATLADPEVEEPGEDANAPDDDMVPADSGDEDDQSTDSEDNSDGNEDTTEVVESKADGTSRPISPESTVPLDKDAASDEPVATLTKAAGKPTKLYKIEGVLKKQRKINIGGQIYTIQKGVPIDVPIEVRDHLVLNSKAAVDVRPSIRG